MHELDPNDPNYDVVNWSTTTGDDNWREKLREMSTLDVPNILQPHEQNMDPYEERLYDAALYGSRLRQNGDMPA